MNAYEEYMQGIVRPMREEMTSYGFKELKTEEEVVSAMENHKGVALILVNSVCGCAAGLARPAIRQAVEQAVKKPDQLFTVFAGQDKEATSALRNYFVDIPPSSPSIAMMKNGELAYFIPREQIEGFAVEQVEAHIVGALERVTTS